jgi:tetratricopeptide (TPR) repeat protein
VRAHAAGRGDELVTLVPELAELLDVPAAAPAAAADGARFRLFDAVAGFLRSVSRDQPLAVFLDDLHAADEPSLLLLRFVAGELDRTRMLIVGCYRDSDVQAGHLLADALPELARQATVRRLLLSGLGRSDVGRLLELTTGEAAADELTARVHAATDGNPLFAGQIAHLLGTTGAPAAGSTPDGTLPIPEGVKEAIRRRLHGQSAACTRVLTLASVLGREFALDALERLSDLAEEDLYEALDEALAARLVSDVPGSSARLRFSHMLIRDVLHDDLALASSRRLHRRAGEVLESLHAAGGDGHAAQIAEHYLAAGAGAAAKALEYSMRAGDIARSQIAYEEAARHYRRALELLATSEDARTRCELHLALGDVLSRAGDGDEAKAACRAAAAIAEQGGLRDQLARAALDYGGRFLWARGGSDPAFVPLLERALAVLGEQDCGARARLLARLASALRDQPSRERRVALAAEALRMARRLGDLPTLTYVIEACWVAVSAPADAERRLAEATELVALAEQTGEQERLYAGHEYRLYTLWELGDRAGVDVELEALTRLAEDLRQPAQIWHVDVARTALALLEGRFGEAEELIAAALGGGERAQSWNARLTQRIQTFMLRREQGRLHEVENTIRRAVHEYPSTLGVRCMLIHLDAALGHHRAAGEELHRVLARDFARNHVDEWWLLALSLLADPCATLPDADAAARVHELLEPYERLNVVVPGEISMGSVARGLGVLATGLSRFDDAERHFEVALGMNRRMRARPWVAHTQLDLAAMLLARGAPGDAERAQGVLGDAVAGYAAIGMQSWAERARALQPARTG